MYRVCKVYKTDNADENGLYMSLESATAAANKLLFSDDSIVFVRIFDVFENKHWDITRP